MAKTLDERVRDLEEIYTDLPELLNTRFERIELTITEMSGRLNLVDRQMAVLTRDVRDLRGGVTRQLVAQDERLRTQDERLKALDERLAAQDGRLRAIQDQLAQILSRLPPSP